jgi:hypothetical protein
MRRVFAPLVAAVTALAILTGPVEAAAPAPPKPPTTQPYPIALAYVNPFTNPAWEPSRTDMGVDWIPIRRVPVVAIGDALILGSDSHASWPGGHILWYRLLDGSHAGDTIYVAEHLKNLLPAGRIVKAGQQIALALPGYPGTEWGWADDYGSPRAYPCYHEGHQTNSGREMARFLESLGAVTYEKPRRGPNRPSGKLC